jgi:hypothetical protein
MLAPYPAYRLHNQHPPSPASRQSGCQCSPKRDPGCAFKRDPSEGGGGVVKRHSQRRILARLRRAIMRARRHLNEFAGEFEAMNDKVHAELRGLRGEISRCARSPAPSRSSPTRARASTEKGLARCMVEASNMAQAWGADDAVLDSSATRETDRKVCALHLRDLTRTHPELAPPGAVAFSFSGKRWRARKCVKGNSA